MRKAVNEGVNDDDDDFYFGLKTRTGGEGYKLLVTCYFLLITCYLLQDFLTPVSWSLNCPDVGSPIWRNAE